MPSFWNIRRNTSRELVDGAAAVDPAPRLEPIQLFTAEAHLVGSIDPGGQRVTDLLNREPTLRVCLADGTWTSIERDSLLAVAPPPHPGVRQRRVHRQKRRVRALTGPYVAMGTAHLIPGIPLDPFLLRSRQHFLPMTNVWLTRSDDPGFEQQLEVALLNVGNVQELHALLTLA